MSLSSHGEFGESARDDQALPKEAVESPVGAEIKVESSAPETVNQSTAGAEEESKDHVVNVQDDLIEPRPNHFVPPELNQQWGPYHQELERKVDTWPELSHILWFSRASILAAHFCPRRAGRNPELIIASFDSHGGIRITNTDSMEFTNVTEPAESHENQDEDKSLRLVIAPDLSHNTIETLGQKFHLNPHVFLTHLCDARSSILELPDSDFDVNHENAGSRCFSPGISRAEAEDIGIFKIDCNTESIHYDILPPKTTVEISRCRTQRRRNLDRRPRDAFGIHRKFHVTPPLFCLPPFSLPPMLPPPFGEPLDEMQELCVSFTTMDRMTVCYKLNETVPTILILLFPLDTDGNEFKSKYKWHRKGGVVTDARLEHRSNVFFADQISANSWEKPPICKLPIEEQFKAINERFEFHIKDLVDSIRPIHKDLEAVASHILLWGAARASVGFRWFLIREQIKIRTAAFYKTVAQEGFQKNESLDMIRDRRDAMFDCQDRISSLIANLKWNEAKVQKLASSVEDEHVTQSHNLQKDLKASLDMIDDILKDIQRMMADAFTDLQLELTNTQIHESRKSIEQNATVKRLTALAFVFIPLSTIASIFGMNVPEISPSPVWKFLVTSATVITAVLFVALYESLTKWCRIVYAELRHNPNYRSFSDALLWLDIEFSMWRMRRKKPKANPDGDWGLDGPEVS